MKVVHISCLQNSWTYAGINSNCGSGMLLHYIEEPNKNYSICIV